MIKNDINTVFEIGEFYMLPHARWDINDNNGEYYDSVLFLENIDYEYDAVVLKFKVILSPNYTKFTAGENRHIREGNNYDKLIRLENYKI